MGYVKTYRLSKNVMNPAEVNFYPQTSLGGSASTLNWTYSSTASGRTVRIPVKANTQYVIRPYGDALNTSIWRIATCDTDDVPSAGAPTTVPVQTIASATEAPTGGTYMWTGSNVKYIVMQINSTLYTDINDFKEMIGLYEVSGPDKTTPATCEPYNTTDWFDWAKKKTALGWTNATTEKAPFESGAKGANSELKKTVKSDPNE